MYYLINYTKKVVLFSMIIGSSIFGSNLSAQGTGVIVNPKEPSSGIIEIVVKNLFTKDNENVFVITNDNKAIKISIKELIARGLINDIKDLNTLLRNSTQLFIKKSDDAAHWTLIVYDQEGNVTVIEPIFPVGFLHPANYQDNCLRVEIKIDNEDDFNNFIEGANTIKHISLDGLLGAIQLNSEEVLVWRKDYSHIVENWEIGDRVLLYFNPCVLGRYKYLLKNLSRDDSIYGDILDQEP